MSAWTPSFIARMVSHHCTQCEAEPGQDCHAKGGRKVMPHAPRHEAAAAEQEAETESRAG